MQRNARTCSKLQILTLEGTETAYREAQLYHNRGREKMRQLLLPFLPPFFFRCAVILLPQPLGDTSYKPLFGTTVLGARGWIYRTRMFRKRVRFQVDPQSYCHDCILRSQDQRYSPQTILS